MAMLALGPLVAVAAQNSPSQHGGSVSAHRPLSTSDSEALQHALAAQDAGHLNEAEALLRDLLRRNPENFDVVESTGLLYAGEEKFSAAFPYLEKATHLKPDSALAFANLGAIDLKLSRGGDAVKALEKSALLDSGNAQTLSNLGLALMQTNQPKAAADAFGKAAALDATNADLLYNWSVALLATGDAAKAIEVAQRVPGAESSAQVQGLLGDAFEHQGQFKEAVDHYQSAMKLDPSETTIYALGIEFLRHWTFDPAIKIYEFGVQRFPESARLHAGLGIAKYANNNFADAAQIFSELLVKDPDNSLYAAVLAHSCNLTPDAIPACGTLANFAQTHPGNAAAATYAAANILRRPPDESTLDSAEKLLKQAINADPKLADAYFQLGMLEQMRGRWQESEAALEKCLTLKPHDAKAHYRLALAYSHTGEKDKARGELDLQQKYSQEEKDELNARLQEVTTFIVSNN